MQLNDPQKSTLGTALLVYMVFMVFLITLFPFDFRIPAKIQIKILTNLADESGLSAYPFDVAEWPVNRKGSSIETIRGYPPLLTSTILEFVFIIAAGLYGGIIYRLQLAAIQRL
jgi:hypothetical protein